MEPPPASAVFEATPKPNMLFSTCKQTHTITETNKRSRSSSSDDHTQPPSKIRKESQDIVNKLNGLNTILTKNVAKGVSKVFRVHSNVKGSIAMHTGGVMKISFLVSCSEVVMGTTSSTNSTNTTNTTNNTNTNTNTTGTTTATTTDSSRIAELLLANITIAELEAQIKALESKALGSK